MDRCSNSGEKSQRKTHCFPKFCGSGDLRAGEDKNRSDKNQNCVPLWHEAHSEVNMLKYLRFGAS